MSASVYGAGLRGQARYLRLSAVSTERRRVLVCCKSRPGVHHMRGVDAVDEAGEKLREAISAHLISIGVDANAPEVSDTLASALSKEAVRGMHAGARAERIAAEATFIRAHIGDLRSALASGRDLVPEKIRPILIEVKPGTRESELFRLATKLWSVPVSRGFGRRLRYLVWDAEHEALIGLFAIGDPVFNLSSRDKWVGWDVEDRRERLVHVMDAYVMGAVPPYSGLIGGKLVASLAASNEVRTAYDRKYGERTSVIRQVSRKAPLVLLTTTSALGRSSLYNRLRLPDGPRFDRIGSTKGYGHFQFSSEVFGLMRQYLSEIEHPYASGNRFGDGPNWRLRVARAALREIGMDERALLNHGVSREVYVAPLAKNWRDILLGQTTLAEHYDWSADAISKSCLNRWVIPRAARDESYRDFDPESVCAGLLGQLPVSSVDR